MLCVCMCVHVCVCVGCSPEVEKRLLEECASNGMTGTASAMSLLSYEVR